MGKVNFKNLGRKTKNTIKRVGTIIKKGASVVHGIVGTIDKMSGGGLSRAISSHPTGAAIMGGINTIANK
jgi:hypothetical protein